MRHREADPRATACGITKQAVERLRIGAQLVDRALGQLLGEVGVAERLEERRRQILRQIEPLHEHVAKPIRERTIVDLRQHDIGERIDHVVAHLTSALERGQRRQPDIARDTTIRRRLRTAAFDLDQRPVLAVNRRVEALAAIVGAVRVAAEEVLGARQDVAIAAARRQMPVHEVRHDDRQIVLEHARQTSPVRRAESFERAVHVKAERRTLASGPS